MLFVLLARGRQVRDVAWATSAAFGVTTGLLIVNWQIPAAPATVPWRTSLSIDVAGGSDPRIEGSPVNAESARYYPGAAQLALTHGDIHLRCSPLIEFHHVSIDHCWSLLRVAGTGRQSADLITANPCPSRRSTITMTGQLSSFHCQRTTASLNSPRLRRSAQRHIFAPEYVLLPGDFRA